jgi:hypothetical protein
VSCRPNVDECRSPDLYLHALLEFHDELIRNAKPYREALAESAYDLLQGPSLRILPLLFSQLN